jgi:hypothetical protein
MRLGDEAAAIRRGERSGCYFETDLRRLLNTLKKPIIEKMKTSQPRKLSSPLARAVCGIQATDSELSGLWAKPRTAIWFGSSLSNELNLAPRPILKRREGTFPLLEHISSVDSSAREPKYQFCDVSRAVGSRALGPHARK